ncbi:MAG TPA: metal-dependent hydrolase [Gemmatimonadales bacterium]
MDNLCHTLVGAALAEAGLKRYTPRATATLLIAANLPDLDALAAFTEQGLAIRRGITHGVPALLILPVLLAGAMILWDRWRSHSGPTVVPSRLFLLALIGVWTHPTLDWMNTYGVRWLMPVDGTWFYGDALFIVDPWLLLLLGGGVLMARRRDVPAPARMALVVAATYIVMMVVLTLAGRRVVREQLRLAQTGYRDLLVAPVFAVPWRRTVLVAEAGQYRFGEIEWLPQPIVRMGGSLERGNALGDVVARAESPGAKAFLRWARFPYYRSDGGQVVADDARYSRRGGSFARTTVPAAGP